MLSIKKLKIASLALLGIFMACEGAEYQSPVDIKNDQLIDSKGVPAVDLKSVEAPDRRMEKADDLFMSTLTSGDQSEKPEDLKVTQNIRKALMSDRSLSINAKNIKIITINGVVTLRGVVNSAEELETIKTIVDAVKGDVSVNDLLEVSK